MKLQSHPVIFARLVIFLSCLAFIVYACSLDRDSSKVQLEKLETTKDQRLDLLDSLNKAAEYGESICYAKEFLKEKGLDSLLHSNIILSLYKSYTYSNLLDEADSVFNRLESIGSSNSNSATSIEILSSAYQSKAKILQDKDDFETSVFFLKKANSLLKDRINDKRVYNYILLTKAFYYAYDFQKAKQYISTADSISLLGKTSIDNNNLIDNWYSILLEIEGDYENALKRNYSILERLESIKKPNRNEVDLFSHTYQNLGYIYSAKRDLKEAHDSYFRALEVERDREDIDSLSMAILLNNLAYSHIIRGQFEEAIENLRDSKKYLNQEGKSQSAKRTQIETRLHLAYCFTVAGIHDSTLIHAKEILRLQKEVKVDLDYTYFSIALAKFRKEEFTSALSSINQSIKFGHASYGERHRLIGRSYALKSRILEKGGHVNEALQTSQKALIAYSRQFSDSDLQKNPELNDLTSYKGGLHALENKNRELLSLLKVEPDNEMLLKAVRNTNKRSIELITELRKDYLHDYSKFHLLSLAMPTYEMGLKTALLQDPTKSDPAILGEAFRISEQGKSMILQDNLRSANALIDSNVPDDLKRKEDSLRSNIAFYGRRINFFESREKLSSYDSVQYESSKRIHLESEEAYSDFIRYLEKNYKSYSDRKKNIKEKNLVEIFHYLDSTSLSMLEYFWGKDAIYAFRLHNGEIRMYEIEKDSSLLNDVEQFRKQVSDASEVYNRGNSREAFETYKKTGYRIYQRLLEPLLKGVDEGQDLVIIPDGQLNVFPFEALPYQADSLSQSFRDLNYLIQKHQIHYALSANLLLKNIIHDKNNYGFIGYAPSYEGARKLDFNTQEVNQIADLVNGEARVGASASKQDFLAKADKWQFLHMAQHAIKAEDPMMSHLLFSKDEKKKDTLSSGADPQKLFAYEIYNQRIDCELAVLNACETGEGKMAQGEGMLSLSRAFRHAGAESVIMNKWAVNDESSYHILSEFYRYLKAGESTASALRNAKLYYLNNSNKSHPYFWAGSALIGSSSELTFSEGSVFNLNSKEDFYMFILICCLGMAFFMGIFYRIQRKRRDRAALFKDL